MSHTNIKQSHIHTRVTKKLPINIPTLDNYCSTATYVSSIRSFSVIPSL